MGTDLRALIHSTGLWCMFGTVGAFLFIMFAGRPLLRLLGGLFELMGGGGLEGTGL